MTVTGVVRAFAAGWSLVIAHPALAEWYEASSDHFVIYADDKERDIQRLAENLERYHSAMSVLMGREVDKPSPSNRVVIYVVGGARDIRELAGGKNKRVAGFYIPRAGGSRAFVQNIRNTSSGELDFATIVLLHEYAHHFLISSSRFAMPRWMNEGAAEYFSASTFKDDGSVIIGRAAQHRANELFYGDPVQLRELPDPALSEQRRTTRKDSFYGKSWLLFHYLFYSKARDGQLRQYQINLMEGQAPLTAAEAAFGDLDTLERELKSYLRSKFSAFVLLPDMLKTNPVTLRKLAPGEAEMLPVMIRSQRGVDAEQAAEILTEARAIAARYPEDPGVMTALAEAEYDAGNDAEAIAAANRAIARDPGRANAYVQKGYAMFRQAREMDDQPAAFEAAMEPFAALNRIENDHPLPLVYYYRSYAERGVWPPENARAALERASELAPFDQQLQLNAGVMLMGEGKNSIARSFLAPLAASPHGGGLAAKAKQLIAVIAKVPDGTTIDLRNLPEPDDAPDDTEESTDAAPGS